MIKIITLLLYFTSFSVMPNSITYQVDGSDFEAYSLLNSKKAPTIILIHDWDGVTKYEIKRAKMLQKLGYSVFAIDLFGKDVRPTTTKGKKEKTGELYKDRKKMRRLMNASLRAAKKQGHNIQNAVTIGYCFGGMENKLIMHHRK